MLEITPWNRSQEKTHIHLNADDDMLAHALALSEELKYDCTMYHAMLDIKGKYVSKGPLNRLLFQKNGNKTNGDGYELPHVIYKNLQRQNHD